MARSANTNSNGGSWSDEEKKTVWERGDWIKGLSPDTWRKDDCGKLIKRDEHGNRKSDYSWEIDHINPVSNKGDDDPLNLQPLHWENNADKGDKLSWICS